MLLLIILNFEILLTETSSRLNYCSVVNEIQPGSYYVKKTIDRRGDDRRDDKNKVLYFIL